jgi:amidohydrolase
MHACGHDAHVAIGLGAARILMNHRAELHGTVKIIFQPAEEGEAGADDVIATGLVNDVDVFFALPLWSPYPSGTLHLSPITVSAAVNMFTIRVHGRGGHGATPEKCADAVAAGAAVVSALQSIVARRLSPMEHALVTVGSFHAGRAGNVIAGEAELKGTFRTLNEETRARVSDLLEKDAQNAAAVYGCTAEVENRRMSDPVVNDERACALARASAEGLTAGDRIGTQKTMMLGDDFANYGVSAPYFYGQVGIADPAKQTDAAHHNGRFRVDEDVLPLAVAWMAAFALRAGETWKD